MMMPGMKPGQLGMGGAGPQLSQMPMSMPMQSNPMGSPAFQPGPGAMGSGGQGAAGSMNAGDAASAQQFMKNAQGQHAANVQQSRANTSKVAQQLGVGVPGGPKGQGIVP